MRYIFSIFAITLALVSCKKDRVIEDAPDQGYDYFPVSVGKYIVYDVDSTRYRALEGDTIHKIYRIKEVLDSVFNDNQGRTTYRMSRYIKLYNPSVSYDSIPWEIKDVWAVNVTKTTAEVVEENTRFVKLIFPVVLNRTWNGNAQNILSSQNYKYTSTNEQVVISGVTYNNVLTVTQKSNSTALGRQYYAEKYAKGIGMIYREINDYVFKVENGVLYPGVISEGLIYKMNIVEYHL